MDSRVERFFQQLKGKRITLCGIGVSHEQLVDLFLEAGAVLTVCDRRDRNALGEKADRLEAKGVQLTLGESYLDHLEGDIIFRTPGIPYFTPALTQARKRGIAVTSEMEVFFDLCPCKIYAVTGSDGKTTTTTLIAQMLKEQGKHVYLGGNIGTPLLPLIREISAEDCAVVELSSFQLISMRKSPAVAVITNIAPNHLDVHRDMEEYIQAKKSIFLHQNAFTKTILNFENDITRSFAPEVRGEGFYFSSRQPVHHGAYLRNDHSCIFCRNGEETVLFPASDIRIPGMHNVENYLAAICAVFDDVSVDVMHKVAKEFQGVEHRNEFVRKLDGVRWYNDSIATSPTRTIAGLNSFSQKLIVIAGGYDKHIPFDPFAAAAIAHIKILILTGATAEKIETCVRSQPGFSDQELQIIRAHNMEEAVHMARKLAQSGDVVTLSPACASFDAYPNFAVRGKHYKELVNNL